MYASYKIPAKTESESMRLQSPEPVIDWRRQDNCLVACTTLEVSGQSAGRRIVLLSDSYLRSIDAGALMKIGKNANRFFEQYNGCSLSTFLSLLFNPKSDYYYYLFNSPWTLNEFERWKNTLHFLILCLLNKRILLPGSARDQDNIRSAMRIFTSSVFSLRDEFIAGKGMELAAFWSDPEQSQSRVEQAVSGIMALKKMPFPLPMDIKYRIAGFLDLEGMLKVCSEESIKRPKSREFERDVLSFIDFFYRVLHQTSPDHQLHLLRALSFYCRSDIQSELFVRRVVLKILGYPPKIEGLNPPVAFLMGALRCVSKVSRQDYPDHHPRIRELMGSFEGFELKFSQLSPAYLEKRDDFLMGFLEICSGFLHGLSQEVSFEKLASLVFCFLCLIPAGLPENQMRSFLNRWINDQVLRLELFRQFVLRPCMKKMFPSLAFKDLASADQLNKLYDAGGNFAALLKPLRDKAMLPEAVTMLNAMSSVFVNKRSSFL